MFDLNIFKKFRLPFGKPREPGFEEVAPEPNYTPPMPTVAAPAVPAYPAPELPLYKPLAPAPQVEDVNTRAKIDLLLANMDLLKTQLQVINEKLAHLESYFNQTRRGG